MPRTVTIELPVDEAAAEALKDADRLASVGRLVSKVARLYQGPDPLAAVLEHTSRSAQEAGLTDAEIDAELADYNAERRR